MNISIIICTYNRAGSLRDVLNSLISQRCDRGFDYEIIVVDNNSKDNTKDVVNSSKSCLKGRLKYFFESRQGKTHALNTGIKQAKGEILAFTDDDVVVSNNWLKVINETFDKYDCMAMGGKVLPIRLAKLPSWIKIDGPYRIKAAVTSFERGNQVKQLKYGDFPPIGANYSFRKAAFEKYGLFNTNLGNKGDGLISSEDVEFCNRLLKNNENLMYIPESIVYHSVDESKFKKSFCRKWYFFLGRGSQRHEEYPPDGVRYFNIPRYLFKQIALNTYKWMHSILTFKKENIAFFYELMTIWTLGKIYANLFDRKELNNGN